jgi:hypothetical protein
MEPEKIFANHIYDNGLITRLYIKSSCNKQQQQLKRNILIKIWAKVLKRYFFIEDLQMTNKHMKRYSTRRPTEKCKSKPS